MEPGKSIILDSTKSGSGISWHALGECYRYGLSVKKNSEKAKLFYEKAVTCENRVEGIVGAYFALDEMFEHGEGVALSHRRASMLFLCAAERSSQKAQ